MDGVPDQVTQPGGYKHVWGRLNGLLVAQAFGQFNDQAWKQVVTLLAMAAVASEAAKLEKTALAQIALMLPLPFFSLPAGVLADRLSKRTVIVAMKVFELVLMLAGAAALILQPDGRPGSRSSSSSWSASRRHSSSRRSTGSCRSSCRTKSWPKATACWR